MRFYKNKTQHSLEIGKEIGLKQALKTRKTSASFSPVKRIIGTVIALSIAVTAAVVGIGVVPTPGNETAKADWLTDLMCSNNTASYAIYGGSTSSIDSARKVTQENIDEKTSQPWGSFIPVAGIPKELETLTAKQGTDDLQIPITALERYGYFNPIFESWKGVAQVEANNGDNPTGEGQLWYGSGGSSSLSEAGPGVIITSEGQPLMFSTSGMQCISAAFSGGEAANVIMLAPKFAIAIAATIYTLTSDLSLSGDSPLAPIGDVIETLILGDGNNKGMKDLLFLDFMLIMVMLGGLVVAWQGLKNGQTTQAIQSVGWMILVGITGMLFLSNPLWLSNTMEKGLGIISSSIEEATLQTSTMSPECNVPNSAENATERKVTCSLWLNSIYKPWINGQFGKDYSQMIKEGDDPSLGRTWTIQTDADINKAAGEEWFTSVKDSAASDNAQGKALQSSILNSPIATDQSRGVFTRMGAQKPLGTKDMNDPAFQNWAYYHMHSQSNWDAPTGVNISEVAYNQLILKSNNTWKSAGEAIPNAFLSLLAAAAPATFMIVIGGSLLSFQIILVILLVIAPFFFTLGFFPGFGRRLLMRWAELITSLFVKRVILVLFLFIFLKIYISILALDISWAYQILFITILTIVALTQKDQISQMVTSQINFGSYNSFGNEEGMKQSAVAGIMGGYYLGKKGTRLASNLGNGMRPSPKRKGRATPTPTPSTPTPTPLPAPVPTPTPTLTPTPTPTPTPVPIPKPTNGGTNKSENGPEGWKWQNENRDENGNLITATRYNEDGTGKMYHGGETYHIQRDANGNTYATKDSDGSRIDPKTFSQLTRKREENSGYSQLQNSNNAITAMEPGSEEYKAAMNERADRARSMREISEGERRKALEEAPKNSTGPGKEVQLRDQTKSGPRSTSKEISSPRKNKPITSDNPITPKTNMTPRRNDEPVIMEYDPETDTYR